MLRGSAFKLMHPDQGCTKNQSVDCLSHFWIKKYQWFAAFLSHLWQYTHVNRIRSIHAFDSFVLEAVQCILVATRCDGSSSHRLLNIESAASEVKLSNCWSWSEVRSWNCTASETQSTELFLWFKTRSPCWFCLSNGPHMGLVQSIWDCQLDKRSNLKMSLWTLGHCDEHFQQLHTFYQLRSNFKRERTNAEPTRGQSNPIQKDPRIENRAQE